MTHPSVYLFYVDLLTPIVLPLVLAIVWKARLRRKLPFVVIGVLAGLGVNVLATFPFGFVLGWLNQSLGLAAANQWEMRGWFNGFVSLVFNFCVSYLALTFLADWMSKSSPSKQDGMVAKTSQ